MELLQACFERVLQMSLTAGWVILAVLLARLLLAFYAVCGALVWHRRKSTR